MFSKRHYEAIAEAFQRSFDDTDGDNEASDTARAVRDRIADVFARDNYAFDRQRFYRACVPGANVRART
jgi:hypothetical protein